MALACAVLLASACRESAGLPEPFETRPVVAPRIAALEREVASDPPIAEPDPELTERVRGLVLDLPMLPSKLRTLQLDEIASIGDAALPVLAAFVVDDGLAEDRRIIAIECAAAIDTPRSVALVAEQIESARAPRVRASAARALVRSSHDELVPRLLLRLKYEMDGETVVWLAVALARFGNYAGLDGVRTLASTDRDSEVQAFAREKWEELASAAGLENGERLWKAWNDGDAIGRVPRSEPSARHRLALWRWIAKLSEHDLRAVDDARFVLSRSDASVVEPLCEALHEKDLYIRVHAAQCLERMGLRARAAGPGLVGALAEARLAPAAAAALGAVGHSSSASVLVRCLDPNADPELRVAAARALASVKHPAAIDALRGLLQSRERSDVRQAAAQSLVMQGHGDDAAPLLIKCLIAPGADASGAEAALEGWLVERTQRGESEAEGLLERWRSFAGPPGETPNPQAVATRQRTRAALLASFVAGTER